MRIVFLLFIFIGFAAISFSQNTNSNILDIRINKNCFRTADKELEIIAETYLLKLRFDKERLQKYSIELDFVNERLEDVLLEICKITKSKYYITNENVIHIINKKDEKKVNLAELKIEQPDGNNTNNKPTRFTITVSGKITDNATGEPLPNVNVAAMDGKTKASSNADGYFTLYGVPSDTSALLFTIVGYTPFKHQLSPLQLLKDIAIEMIASKNMLSEVVITARKDQSFKLNQKVSMIKLTPSKIATLPNVGEKDIFRAFQLMPGVSAGNEQTAGLYVRGGTPDQNLVLFDGFTVYNVDHLFGFFSAFNSNAIKDVELYKGGYESKYGGRISSVVDITGKEGNKKKFNIGGDIGFLSINGITEGPIGKKASFLMTYRRSFASSLYDKISDKVSNGGDSVITLPNGRTLTPGVKSWFDDMNARLTFNPTKKDVLSLSFYKGKDNVDNQITPPTRGPRPGGGTGPTINIGTTDLTEWGNTGASIKWSRKWNPQFYSNALISYSSYYSNRDRSREGTVTRPDGTVLEIKNGTLESNDLKDVSIKTDFEWKANKNHSIEFGYQLTSNRIQYNFAQNDTISIIDRDTRGKTGAIYLQDNMKLLNDKLNVTGGIRTSYFEPTSKLYFEPRLNVIYDISDKLKLKGSAGQYYQFVKRVIREDILEGSRDFWVLTDNDKLPVSSSQQFVLGAAWENKDFLIDVEGYYKKVKGLSEYTLRFTPTRGTINYQESFFEGTGYAKGIDFLLQKKFGKYNGWIGYTLGEVKNNFPVYGQKDFYASNDVTHEFKMVHTYKWKRFDFSLTWMYLTGKPYTAPSGGYQITLLDGTTQDYLSVSNKNGLRLLNYHRMDFAATYNYGRPGKGNGTIGLSLFNLYNRENIWYKNFDIIQNEIIATDVKYLGFTPNLSFTWRLR
jgi:ferric enterobactin receptor